LTRKKALIRALSQGKVNYMTWGKSKLLHQEILVKPVVG
jgi:hypothetical protein